jgi:hypothetical protein
VVDIAINRSGRSGVSTIGSGRRLPGLSRGLCIDIHDVTLGTDQRSEFLASWMVVSGGCGLADTGPGTNHPELPEPIA